MAIFEKGFLKPVFGDAVENARRLKTLERQNRGLQLKIQEMAKRNILAFTDEDDLDASGKPRGNTYNSYDAALSAINSKYTATAKWGVLQVGNIVDLRAAFIMGQGPEVVADPGAQRELDFVNALFEYNYLDKYAAQEFAKESELEGKILLRLGFEKNDEMISVRFVSYLDKKYSIETAPNDYLDYKFATWTPDNETEPVKLNKPEFVYAKFGGRVYDPNAATAKTMKCLTQIDRLDKALFDLRKIDRLFASPTPHVECLEHTEAEQINDDVKELNWRIGKFFAHTGKFEFATPPMHGAETLIKEITLNSKIISGTTGVPVHFLGFPELLSNRSTSRDMVSGLAAATSRERETWKSVLEQTARKAMEMANEKMFGQMSDSRKLRPEKISIEISLETESAWEHLRDVMIPLALADKISNELWLGMIPGVDIDAEKKRMAKVAEDREKSMQTEMERIQGELEAERNRSTNADVPTE